MTRNGSLAIVNKNIANGGPNAIKVHPKNSITVMIVDIIVAITGNVTEFFFL